jgi:quinol monooxygenase YgiN
MYFIVKRKLKDYASWKSMLQDKGLRREKGSKGATVYRNAKKPDEVFLVFEWDDHKSYLDYINLPEVQKALSETGTTEIIEVSESFRLPS